MALHIVAPNPARLDRISVPLPFVAFIYRNAKAYKPNASHIGLGVSALQHVIVLKRHGVKCDIYGANEIGDVITVLKTLPSNSIVIIEALWLITSNVQILLNQFPEMNFIIRCHSQVGFLQVEPQAIQLLREQVLLQELDVHFQIAANSARLSEFVKSVYNTPCLLLPNLYDNQRITPKSPLHPHDRLIRVGGFGALRNLKMHCNGAAGALETAKRLGKDLEFHISIGRDEGGGSVIASLRNMFEGLRWARLIEDPWTAWTDFKRLVSYMDLCVQVSATETFNIVTADSLAEGVPCVTGPAIAWNVPSWVAEIDDPSDIASKLIVAYHDPHASSKGITALQTYINLTIATWMGWLAQFH